MPEQPKDLQKTEESKEGFWEKTAKDSLSKTISILAAGGILAVISALVALIVGLPIYLYLPLGAFVFCLSSIGWYFFLFLPTNRRLNAEIESLKAEIELLKAVKPETLLLEKPQHQIEIGNQTSSPIPLGFELKKLEPNLFYLDNEIVPVYEDETGAVIEGVKESVRNFSALVQPYHNDPHRERYKQPIRKIGGVNDVSAQMAYRCYDTDLAFKIHRGVWLNEKKNQVNFGINDTRRLIIATIEGTDPARIFAVGRDFSSAHPEGFTTRKELSGDIILVRARLITELDGTKVEEREFILTVVREPEIKLELVEVYHWQYRKLENFIIEGYRLLTKYYEKSTEDIRNNQVSDHTEIANEAKEWESRCADFIGKYLTETQKESFLKCYPSIDAGLKGERRAPNLLQIINPQDARPSAYLELGDSIKARIDKLSQFKKYK